MPTKNPRVNIAVEPPLYKIIRELADNEQISMSTLARDLILEAIELREDIALDAFAEKRMKSFSKESALSHEETWA